MFFFTPGSLSTNCYQYVFSRKQSKLPYFQSFQSQKFCVLTIFSVFRLSIVERLNPKPFPHTFLIRHENTRNCAHFVVKVEVSVRFRNVVPF